LTIRHLFCTFDASETVITMKKKGQFDKLVQHEFENQKFMEHIRDKEYKEYKSIEEFFAPEEDKVKENLAGLLVQHQIKMFVLERKMRELMLKYGWGSEAYDALFELASHTFDNFDEFIEEINNRFDEEE